MQTYDRAMPPTVLETLPTLALATVLEPDRAVVGTAFGIPLVSRGGLVHNVGGGGTPGLVVDPAAPLDLPAGARALVLHDVVDVDGAHAALHARLPEARAVLRHRAVRSDMGDDAEAFLTEQLSTSRRRKMRKQARRLDRLGGLDLAWATPDRADELFDRFHRLTVDRVVHTGRWDAAVTSHEGRRRAWREAIGGPLGVHVLSVDGHALSFITGYHVGPWFVQEAPIVDRNVEQVHVSLGPLHKRLLVDDLVERGVRTCLLGKGDHPHKTLWETGRYAISTFVVPFRHDAVTRTHVRAQLARQRLRRALTASGREDELRRGLHRAASVLQPSYRRELALPAATPFADHDDTSDDADGADQ